METSLEIEDSNGNVFTSIDYQGYSFYDKDGNCIYSRYDDAEIEEVWSFYDSNIEIARKVVTSNYRGYVKEVIEYEGAPSYDLFAPARPREERYYKRYSLKNEHLHITH